MCACEWMHSPGQLLWQYLLVVLQLLEFLFNAWPQLFSPMECYVLGKQLDCGALSF